jgi:hypothetical protein
MEAYTAMLRATRGLFEAVGEPDRGTFARFVESLKIQRQFPGIQGIGWAKALRPDAVAAHEQQMRGAGYPRYAVWPRGERPLDSAITQLEPLDWRNERAIGYDMFSDPTRREAMERARDTGRWLPRQVDLVQEVGAESRPGSDVPVRPAAPRPPSGAPPSPPRMGVRAVPANLLVGTLERRRRRRLDAFDGADRAPSLLFGRASRGRPRHSRVERGDRRSPWTLRYSATSAFGSRTEQVPAAAFAAGSRWRPSFWMTRADA